MRDAVRELRYREFRGLIVFLTILILIGMNIHSQWMLYKTRTHLDSLSKGYEQVIWRQDKTIQQLKALVEVQGLLIKSMKQVLHENGIDTNWGLGNLPPDLQEL